LIKPRCRQRSSRSAISTEKSKVDVVEKWGIESDIFKQIVVDAIVHDSETTANNKLLVVPRIVCKTYPWTEVVLVLVPDGMLRLERAGRNPCVVPAICREERVGAGGRNWSSRRTKIEI